MGNLYRYRFRNVSEGVLDHYKNDAKLLKFNYRKVCKSIQAHQHALRSVITTQRPVNIPYNEKRNTFAIKRFYS